MNKDIRLSTTFFSHRKTKKLQRLLGDHGVICLVRLWTRVALEKSSGVLSGWNDEDIEIEADFTGEPGTFVEALLGIGFLDKEENYVLHNWEGRQEWVVNAKERSDRARLLRMAKTHNKTYKRLVNDGYTGVTRKQYNKLTEIQRPVNDTLSAPLTPVPIPVPAPVPDPAPIKKKEKKRNVSVNSFKPDFIPQELWDELISNRKFKKLQNSKLALKTFTNSLRKAVDAGYPIEKCIGEYVVSPWKRFNHEWMAKPRGQPDQSKTARQNNIDQISTVRKAVEDGTGFNPYRKTQEGNSDRNVDQDRSALPQ